MRRWLSALLIICAVLAVIPICLRPAYAAITLVQSNSGAASSTSNFTATLNSTPSNGNFLLLIEANQGDGNGNGPAKFISSISGGGVTWQKAVATSATTNYSVEIWYGIPVSNGGTSISVAMQSSTNNLNPEWIIEEWSGLASSPVDVAAADSSNTFSSTTEAPPALTTTNSNDLLVAAAFAIGPGTTGSWTNSYTAFTDAIGSGGTVLGAAYQIVLVTGTYSTSRTTQNSVTWISASASFKNAGGGGRMPLTGVGP